MAKVPPKASVVFANAFHMFGKKGTFAEAFPTIDEAQVEVEESEYGNLLRKHYLSSKDGTLGKFADCGNLRCYNGGIDVQVVLREMVSKGLTEYVPDIKPCQGYEGSAKTRRSNRRMCMHFFKVKATVKYKTPSAPAQPDTVSN